VVVVPGVCVPVAVRHTSVPGQPFPPPVIVPLTLPASHSVRVDSSHGSSGGLQAALVFCGGGRRKIAAIIANKNIRVML